MLALPDEPELTTGEIFDSGRVVSQPSGFLAQQGILCAGTLDGLLERPELLTLLDGFEKSLLAHERIDEHDAANQQQPVLDRTSATTAGCGAG